MPKITCPNSSAGMYVYIFGHTQTNQQDRWWCLTPKAQNYLPVTEQSCYLFLMHSRIIRALQYYVYIFFDTSCTFKYLRCRLLTHDSHVLFCKYLQLGETSLFFPRRVCLFLLHGIYPDICGILLGLERSRVWNFSTTPTISFSFFKCISTCHQLPPHFYFNMYP